MTLPIEQFNKLQINGPKVFSASDSSVVSSTALLSELDSTLRYLSVDFFATLNRAFHYLHQRSAPMTQIQAKHAEMHAELSKLSEQMLAVWNKAREASTGISTCDDSCEKAQVLSKVMHIELLASHLHKKSVELCTLLDDTSRNEALEFYKLVVRDCEALASCATVADKISGLQGVFAKVSAKIAPNMSPAVSDVYDTMLLYIRYAALCFTREAAGTSKQVLELQALDEQVKKAFAEAPVDLEATGVAAENGYLADSASVELPNENKFRNGNWTTWLTTFRYFARYAPIVNQKDSLQGIAQALYRMECSVLKRMEACSVDGIEQDIKICEGLERLIDGQLQSLAAVPIAREIHAGWYYVAALQTQAKVVKASLNHFKEMATCTYAKERELLDRLVKVQPAKSSLVQLCQLTQEVAALTVENIALSKIIDQNLAHVGAKSIVLTEDELKVPDRVFTKTFVWGDATSEVVHAYLLKGLMKYLYFPKGAQRELDPRFDAVFFMLKCDSVYKEGFAGWLQGFPWLKQMHDAYMDVSDMKSNVFLTNAVSSVASTLLAKPLVGIEDIKARLEKAYKIASTIKVKSTPNEQIRFAWMKQLIQDFENEFKSYLGN